MKNPARDLIESKSGATVLAGGTASRLETCSVMAMMIVLRGAFCESGGGRCGLPLGCADCPLITWWLWRKLRRLSPGLAAWARAVERRADSRGPRALQPASAAGLRGTRTVRRIR